MTVSLIPTPAPAPYAPAAKPAIPVRIPTGNASSSSSRAPTPSKVAEASVKRASSSALDSLQSAQQFLVAAPASSVVAVTVQRKELTANLALAKETKEYVLEKVPISPNYLERLSKDFLDELKKNGITMETFHGVSSSALEAVNSQHVFEDFNEAAIQSIAATAEQYQMGTCLEMSAAGYAYFQKKHPSQKVEIFMIDGEDGNHVFLVIGRDPKSKPEDYKNWGSGAVVCDPWADVSYPAADIERNLRSFKELQFEENGYVHTLFSPFEPTKQRLSLLLR